MNPERLFCFLFLMIICIGSVGVGFGYSAYINTHDSIQSEWCVVIPDGFIITSEDAKTFETSSIAYTDSSARSGFMTIIFEIGASEETNLEGSVLSISSPQLGSGTIGSCVLKSSGSTYTGTISGLYVSSGSSFTITGQLSSGSMSSVSMDITVYPEVVS